MGYDRGFDYGYGSMMGVGWFEMLVLFALGALVIAGIVLLVVWLIRGSGGHAAPRATPPHPGEVGHHEAVVIAKKRLASGEITKDEYDEIMRALGE